MDSYSTIETSENAKRQKIEISNRTSSLERKLDDDKACATMPVSSSTSTTALAAASTSTMSQPKQRPNSELTEEEKKAKRRLKKSVKVQSRIDSLRKKIRHAQGRKDKCAEANARKGLEALLIKEKDIVKEMNLDESGNVATTATNTNTNTVTGEDRNQGDAFPSPESHVASASALALASRGCYSTQMEIVKNIASPLILQYSNVLFQCPAAKDAIAGEKSAKEAQNSNAIKLLKHMTKGTQELDMFQDEAALWGYTRLKFYERALLLCCSLGRIRIRMWSSSEDDKHNSEESDLRVMGDEKLLKDDARASVASNIPQIQDDVILEQNRILEKVWNVILKNGIRKACSIGCGPGNDAVGLLSFLQMELGTKEEILDEMLLVDWSINEWKSTVLDPLTEILVAKNSVRSEGIKCTFCDVTKDLGDDSNGALKKHLCLSEHEHEHGGRDRDRDRDLDGMKEQADYDIYLTSYLLTETKGKWEPFFRSLIEISRENTIFYFAEPIPWQLHRFMEIFHYALDFVWIDSSMDHPMLQGAQQRAGPACVLAIKR